MARPIAGSAANGTPSTQPGETRRDVDAPSTTPKRRATGLDRQRILDATDTILIDEGYDATTIRRIAKELGCAVGSIYRYFADKRDLLTAVTERRLEPVAMRVEIGAPLEKTMFAYLDAAREQPEQYRLMYWLAAVGKRDDSPAVPQVIQQIIDGWARQLHDANRAWQIWAELHGCVMLGLSETKTQQIVEELSLLTLPLVAEVSTQPSDPNDTPSPEPQHRSYDRIEQDVPYADPMDIADEAHRVFTEARSLEDAMAMFDRRNARRACIDLEDE